MKGKQGKIRKYEYIKPDTAADRIGYKEKHADTLNTLFGKPFLARNCCIHT
jgi:hypothetical protein